MLSKVEVAFGDGEKQLGAVSSEVEAQIDAFWAPGSPIKLVEFFELIGDRARALMRQGIEQGWGALKPMDAMHLATAQQMNVEEMHTYCERILRWSGHAGFPINRPHAAQAQLDVG